jgi:hypothetical protein
VKTNSQKGRADVAFCWKCDNARRLTRTSMMREGRRFESGRGLRKTRGAVRGQGAPALDQEDLCWVDSAV